MSRTTTKAVTVEPSSIKDRLEEAQALVNLRRQQIEDAREEHDDLVSDSGSDDTIKPSQLSDAASAITIAEQRARAAENALRGVESEQRKAVADRLATAVAEALAAAIEMPVAFGPLPAETPWGLEVTKGDGQLDLARGTIDGHARISTKRPSGLGPITADYIADVFPAHAVKVEQAGEDIIVRGAFHEGLPSVLPMPDNDDDFRVAELASQVAFAVGMASGPIFGVWSRLGNEVPRLAVKASDVSLQDAGTDDGVHTVRATLTLLGRDDDRENPIDNERAALTDGINTLSGTSTPLGRIASVSVVSTGEHRSTTANRPPFPTAVIRLELVSRG